MVLLLLFACPVPGGPIDSGSPWNGGQTGSEAISCDDEESTALEVAEDAEVDGVGEHALTFTWDDDWREDPLTLTVTRTSDLFDVASEECGDRQEYTAQVQFVLESGAYNLDFPAVVQKADSANAVYEFWAEVDDVTVYAAFPESGPTGTLTGDVLIGRF